MSGDLNKLYAQPPVLGSDNPPNAIHESGSPLSSQPQNSDSIPSYHRWALSLHNLLDDREGVELYVDFLKIDNVESVVHFWFACKGLKQKNPNDEGEKIYELIKAINSKYVRTKKVPVEDKTRQSIQEKYRSMKEKYQSDDDTSLDQGIFDTAQKEVEDWMSRNSYPKFFESDIFIQYVQAQQMGPESDSHSEESNASGRGPSLPDNSSHFYGLQNVEGKSNSDETVRQTQAQLGTRDNGVDDKLSSAEPSGRQSHQYYHPSVNNTGPNVNSTKQMKPSVGDLCNSHIQSPVGLPTVHEDTELECHQGPRSSLTSSLLTTQSLNLMSNNKHNIKPEFEAGVYLQDYRIAPNPYHVYNSSYNPVSRQDSDIQSMSSGAPTTDDNQSSFTESSSHYSDRRIPERKYVKKQVKKMQEQSRRNRDTQCGQSAVQTGAFIPRTAKVYTEPKKIIPADFAAALSQRLEKLKHERDLQEKLTRKLSEDTGSLVSNNSSNILADICKEKLLSMDEGEGDQSILDDHVSRVWTDKTPSRSPGGRGRSAASRQAYSGHGASNSHLAVTGGSFNRGPYRDPPSGPVRNTGHPSGPGYQDLPYEMDPRVSGASRIKGIVSHQLGSEQKNDRVMEWMLDVEKRGGVRSHDQWSQSTKSQTRHGNSYTQERGTAPVRIPQSVNPGDITVAIYTFPHEKGEVMPYRVKIPTLSVTLKHIKDYLPKKGAFRFYFKTKVDGDICYEEETNDTSLVPLWEGKVLVQCRLLD